MGCRVKFYIGPDDLKIIDDIIKECGPALIYSQNEDRKQVLRDSVAPVRSSWFEMRYAIFLEEDVRPTPKIVPETGAELFDTGRMAVLELIADVTPNVCNYISMSRFFYEADYWEGDLLCKKSPQFLDFCNQIFSRVRRRLKKSDRFWYVGPHAEAMMASGVDFRSI